MSSKFLLCLLVSLLMPLASTQAQSSNADALQAFKQRAAKFKAIISVPDFETTTNAIGTTLRETKTAGDTAFDRIGALQPDKVTFANTVGALDDIGYNIGLTADRFSVIKETSTD